MHYLHKILVNTKKNDLTSIDEIRDYAENETEQYFEKVFDWRETSTAGRWADEYPINVLVGKDNPEKLLEEVEEVKKWQEDNIAHYLEEIKKFNVETLEDVVNEIKAEKEKFSMLPFYLRQLSILLYGEYDCGSNFYDIESMEANITKELLAELKEHPEDYALVFFDYHN